MFNPEFGDESIVGSPLKKQRASIYDADEDAMKSLLNKTGLQAPMSNVLGLAEAAQFAGAGQSTPPPPAAVIKTEIEEEL
jgi:hypothetical protein